MFSCQCWHAEKEYLKTKSEDKVTVGTWNARIRNTDSEKEDENFYYQV